MDKISIDFKDKRLIHKLYINEKAIVKGEYDIYEKAEVQIGGLLKRRQSVNRQVQLRQVC